MAHYYQVSTLIDFLIELIDQHVPLAEKILIADQYHVTSLMASSLSVFKTTLDLKVLIMRLFFVFIYEEIYFLAFDRRQPRVSRFSLQQHVEAIIRTFGQQSLVFG